MASGQVDALAGPQFSSGQHPSDDIFSVDAKHFELDGFLGEEDPLLGLSTAGNLGEPHRDTVLRPNSPWEKSSRATSMPARISRSNIAAEFDAGPMVQTILVLCSGMPMALNRPPGEVRTLEGRPRVLAATTTTQ